MKRISTLLSLVLCCSSLIWGQTRYTGSITDAEGLPIIGATVLAKGTQTGVLADNEGKFSIEVPAEVTTLVISYFGFLTQEIQLGAERSLSITLLVDDFGLDEVVITGYTAQRRKDLTGAVSSIKAADIENIQLPSIETALQGRTAGVQVVKNSGKPGGGIDVNIRGRTSITAGNQPLYVVDGIPMISSDNLDFSQEPIGGSNVSVLADMNPDEIESIEVLKDAASAAIYGSRAANGVVLITTKSGSREGKTTVNVNTSYGQQWAPNLIQGISGDEYQTYITEIFGPLLVNTIGVDATYQNVQDFILGPIGTSNTRWLDEIFREGALRDINLNISGGDAKTQFFVSGGYSDEEGTMKGSRFTRYSGRLNVKHRASEDLKFDMNMGYTQSNTAQVINDNNIFGAMGAAVFIPPVVPIFNEDGSYGSAFGIENAVAAVTEYRNNLIRGRLLGKVSGTYNLLNNLSVRASFGGDFINQNENIYEPRVLQSSNTGRAIVATITDYRFIHDYVLNFNEQLAGGVFSAYGGTSFQEEKINTTFTEAVNFPTDGFRGLSSGAEPLTTDGAFSGDNLKSYFGGFNYNFKDRYYLTANFRADGSSRFVNDPWGFFPGFSAAWNLSNESFLSGRGFDLLKIRLGWGKTGNNAIPNFASRQLYSGGANYMDAPGTAPSQLGNPDLKWETTTQSNIGLDLAFLDSRVSVNLDFYIKNTTDLLLSRPIPTTSGFLSVLQNVGEVENKGIDLSISTVNLDMQQLKWRTTFTVGYLKNEVIKLVDGIPFGSGFANRIAEGQSLGAFFGHQVDGIFQNQEEVDAHATQPGAEPGDIRFADISGGAGPDGIVATADDLPPDGVINDADRTYLGKALPDFMGGINNNISFYGVEVAVFFQFATGHSIFNNNNVFAEGLNSVFSPTRRAWDTHWQQEGDQTDIPRLIRNDPNNNRRVSDRFVEDADYIRLKTLTVGYNLPAKVLSGLGIQKLKIYFSGYNLWTETGYSWFDPEVNMFDGSNTSLGTDFLSYPQPRSIVGGINLGF